MSIFFFIQFWSFETEPIEFVNVDFAVVVVVVVGNVFTKWKEKKGGRFFWKKNKIMISNKLSVFSYEFMKIFKKKFSYLTYDPFLFIVFDWFWSINFSFKRLAEKEWGKKKKEKLWTLVVVTSIQQWWFWWWWSLFIFFLNCFRFVVSVPATCQHHHHHHW